MNDKESYLHNLPIVSRFIRQINLDLKKYGLQKAMVKIIKRTKTKLRIFGKNRKLEDVLKSKPVVIVSNHPYEAETIAIIASLPARDDTSLIINAKSLGICPNLNKYLIPVYIEHHVNEKSKKTIWDRCLNILHPRPTYSEEEEHRKNIESIRLASQKVKKGGMVIIFPGRRSIDGRWFSGVGHLLKGAKNTESIYIVNIFIKGSSHLDYLRLVPGIRLFLPTGEIYFSEAKIINNILEKDPKTITSILEKEYNDWLDSLH